MSMTQHQSYLDRPLFPLTLFLAVLAAYIWATPLRDLFGLEARNALFTKNMISDGPGLIPMLMGTPYADYPPLYFWLSWLFSLPAGRVTPLSAVLPSALAAAAMVAVTFMLARKISAQTALIAALALATCPDYWLKAGRATIDMLLALWVSLAVFLLYLRYRRPAAIAGVVAETTALVMMLLAFFTKGPVGLALPVGIWATFLICERKWRSLLSFAMKSLLLASACIGIELLVLWHAGGGELIRKVYEAQLASRLNDQANEPLFYYPFYLLFGAAPWWIPACLGFYLSGRRHGGNTARRTFLSDLFSQEIMRLAACWFFFVLILFTAASTRHNRYLLPLFPALFLLIGRGIELFLVNSRLLRRQRAAGFLNYLFWLIIAGVTIMFLTAPLSYRPPVFFWLVWSTCSLFVYELLSREATRNIRLPGLAMLCAGCIMAAEAMMIEPWISQQESGRVFVRDTEGMIEKGIPVVLYKINPDGDGIKYALHSSRPSEKLFFVNSLKEINKIPSPFLLIAFNKAENELAMLDHGKSIQKIAQGLLHQDEITSWLFTDKKQGMPWVKGLTGLPTSATERR